MYYALCMTQNMCNYLTIVCALIAQVPNHYVMSEILGQVLTRKRKFKSNQNELGSTGTHIDCTFPDSLLEK
jgi:hypothetical protein